MRKTIFQSTVTSESRSMAVLPLRSLLFPKPANNSFREPLSERATVNALSVRTLNPANIPPTAALTSDVSSGNAPLTVNFDGSGSSDTDGNIVEYAWDWDGDGVYDGFTDTPLASHTYPAAGTYHATLRVTDDQFGRDSASLTITAPASQYSASRLINLGTHRWSIKPEVGVSVPKGRWDLDGYLGFTFYSANDDFYPGGKYRTQDPVLAIQGHVSYTIRPRLWVAADGTWYRGGSAQVEGGTPSSNLNNARGGVTVSLPVGNRYPLKVAYGSGIVARTGTNFRTVSVAWQTLWLSRKWSGR